MVWTSGIVIDVVQDFHNGEMILLVDSSLNDRGAQGKFYIGG